MSVKGGKRPGAGRKKGSKSKATIERENGHAEIVAQAKAEGIQPLEVMLRTMRQAWDDGTFSVACAIAKDAAPYVHPRLAAIEHAGNQDKPLTHIVTGVPRTKEEAEQLLAMNGMNGHKSNGHARS